MYVSRICTHTVHVQVGRSPRPATLYINNQVYRVHDCTCMHAHYTCTSLDIYISIVLMHQYRTFVTICALVTFLNPF